jgi:hypothetical protein
MPGLSWYLLVISKPPTRGENLSAVLSNSGWFAKIGSIHPIQPRRSPVSPSGIE